MVMSTEADDADAIDTEHEQLIYVLHQGILTGTVVLSEEKDTVLLMFALGSRVLNKDAEIVQHFISTGEIMEALAFAWDEYRRAEAVRPAPGVKGFLNRKSPSREAKEQLIRLREHDIARAELNKERDHQGDDETLMNMPLEIRMGFAGCFDEVEADDIRSSVNT